MEGFRILIALAVAAVALQSVRGDENQPLQCYSCVKVSPPVLCAKATDKDHPPCKVPFTKSNKMRCENEDDSCIAVTQVHVGTVLNLFGCDTCESVHSKAPTAKCVECKADLCNTVAPTSCDIV